MKYEYVKSLEELPKFNPELPVFCDIETDGLYVNTRLIQYYQPETDDKVYILDVDYFGEHDTQKTDDVIMKILGKTNEPRIKRSDIKKLHQDLWLVWWNGAYDMGTLRFSSKKVDDLWYMAKLALPQLDEFNLDKVTNYLYPAEDFYYGLDKKKLQKAKFKPGILSEEQLRYSATDVYVMKKIWDKIANSVIDKSVYKLDAANLDYAARWQQTGLKVDRKVRSEEEYKVKQELELVTSQLPDGLNVNSYKQVRALLNSDKSDADYLIRRANEGCEYSGLILKKRGLLKTLNFLENYDFDRVYSHYNPYGTRTGRWSSKGGDRPDGANLQQLPRKLKHIFGYEESSDRILIGADLPTAELRLAAAIYVDDEMVNAFKNNIDLHKLTASKTMGKTPDEVTSDERKKAKAENFGLLYGMGAEKFMLYAYSNYGIELTLEEATLRRDNWLKLYKGIAAKHKVIKNKIYKDNNFMVFTPLGRWVKPNTITDALNIPIQGAVAEISKLWIYYMWEEAQKEFGDDYVLPICNMVHDSITLDIDKKYTDLFFDIIKRSQLKAWKNYCKLDMIKVKDIPMEVEVGVSKHYGGAS